MRYNILYFNECKWTKLSKNWVSERTLLNTLRKCSFILNDLNMTGTDTLYLNSWDQPERKGNKCSDAGKHVIRSYMVIDDLNRIIDVRKLNIIPESRIFLYSADTKANVMHYLSLEENTPNRNICSGINVKRHRRSYRKRYTAHRTVVASKVKEYVETEDERVYEVPPVRDKAKIDDPWWDDNLRSTDFSWKQKKIGHQWEKHLDKHIDTFKKKALYESVDEPYEDTSDDILEGILEDIPEDMFED